MTAVAPSTQSSLVWLTISMMVRTPRPSSPTRRPRTPAISISLDAFDRSPSLSFSRWMRIGLRDPSGHQRGTQKQVRPPAAWPSIRKASDIGAEQNHLCPVRRYVPAVWSSASALVVLARTSEPPCFSVRAMPQVMPSLRSAGPSVGS
jgi:hypothetical protein